MKILFVAQYGPLAASSRTRVFDYLPLLRRAGVTCDVKIVTPDDLIKRNTRGVFSRLLYYVLSYSRALWTGWACVFTAPQYDAILIQKVLFSFPIPHLLRRYRHKIFFDFDDAIFTLENPNAGWINRLRTRRRAMGVPAMLQIAHCAIVENAYTAEFAARYCSCVSQITGPIDTARYVPRKKTTGEKVVLGWIGSQWTTRYLDLIRDPLAALSRQCPNLELRLIGAGDFDVPNLKIERMDWALETEVGHLQTFDIGLMPLPDDPFTRGKGGYKLLQYMACGLPVVASPVEINREIVTHGKTGFLAETEVEWIEFLGTLIKNKTLRNRMGAAGRARVIAHYALKKSSDQLLALLQRSIHQCDTLSQ
ncbi:MAG: glycosyltransferase family 4 protein [Candidatus Latescibacteria bacterium]|nr:glycosyltransferase family 4 protein [Candidatus Latescibacterota bacterium]